jgi:phenylpropionate dioxygenase-like ring-hydroxylating dioxygenase large terminal subunit
MKSAGSPSHRRSNLPMYQDIIDADARPAPAVFREYSEIDVDVPTVPRARYTDKAFFDLELERMWPRVWQLACREEQIPETGDCLLYESPGASLLLVRSSDSEIKGYYNTCRHRGMKLCAADTSVRLIRCPYHGFTWNLDGTLAKIPSAWDFPHIKKSEFGLAEVRVSRWGGFVFVNRDPSAPPLESYLANLPAHFADWPFESMYLAVVIRKEIPANWKTCIEGFIESMHVAELHSQARPFSGDSSTQYDVWPGNENISRFLEPSGIQSEEHPSMLNEQEVYSAMLRVMTGSDQGPQLPAGVRARTAMAELSRTAASTADGRDYSALSDTEALDPAQYSIFPNIVTFRTLGFPFLYRFLPMRDDPNRSRFDFMIFRAKPEDGSPLPEVKRIDLGPEDTYSDCGALPPWLGQIYDQDSSGLAQVQEGLRAGGPRDIVLAQYQEVRIRHHHQTLMRYISEPLKSAGAR